MTMTCARGAEPREAAKLLGAPTATASAKIGAIVRARRHAAVPRFPPLPPRVFTSILPRPRTGDPIHRSPDVHG
jgi:hypothetical protein